MMISIGDEQNCIGGMKAAAFLEVVGGYLLLLRHSSQTSLRNCADIADISPNPPAVMQLVDWNVHKVGIQVTFSKPVTVRNNRVKPAYLSPIKPPNEELHFLDTSVDILEPVHIYYNWWGSERVVFLIFDEINSNWRHR